MSSSSYHPNCVTKPETFSSRLLLQPDLCWWMGIVSSVRVQAEEGQRGVREHVWRGAHRHQELSSHQRSAVGAAGQVHCCRKARAPQHVQQVWRTHVRDTCTFVLAVRNRNSRKPSFPMWTYGDICAFKLHFLIRNISDTQTAKDDILPLEASFQNDSPRVWQQLLP